MAAHGRTRQEPTPIRKYFRTWGRLFQESARFAVLSEEKPGGALHPLAFAGTNFALLSSAVYILHKTLHTPRPADVLSPTWEFYLVVLIISTMNFLLLRFLLKAPSQFAARPTFWQLFRALVYVLAGPALLYQILLFLLLVGALWLGLQFNFPPLFALASVWVTVLIQALVSLYYAVRVLRSLYQAGQLATTVAPALSYLVALTVVGVSFHSISLESMSPNERRIVRELIWGGIAQDEMPPIFFCRDLDELKKFFAIPAEKERPLALSKGLAHILSKDYQSEMYGYRLEFGGTLEEGCFVEAIPISYPSDTRLSFYSDVWSPSLVYAGDHQGGHANRRDKIVRIPHVGSFLRSRD